jgi:uncharacterized iron-regulated membrane protein
LTIIRRRVQNPLVDAPSNHSAVRAVNPLSRETTFWEQWVQRPQSLWVRRAIFQVHLWVGIGFGLYIFLISVSGSVIVYRDELATAFTHPPVFVAQANHRLTSEDLKQSAQRLYPGYRVTDVLEQKRADQAAEISMRQGKISLDRFFDPYTGADLGDALTTRFRILFWLVDLHDNLLSGAFGRSLNFIGGILVTLLGATGLVIWWPGIKHWRRSATIDWKARFQRLVWNLHGSIGIWFFVFILLWGLSGIYLARPQPFHALLDFLDPPVPFDTHLRFGDQFLFWLARLHFGRFAGWYVKMLWTVFGLVPATLFVSGALMWWNRVLLKRSRHWRGEVDG